MRTDLFSWDTDPNIAILFGQSHSFVRTEVSPSIKRPVDIDSEASQPKKICEKLKFMTESRVYVNLANYRIPLD